jgi:bacteriocin biosynthesis cyclodehydratase domain-containing protein
MPVYLRPQLDLESWRGGSEIAPPVSPEAELLNTLFPLLDGSHTHHEVIGSMLSVGYELEPVAVALDQLDRQGWLREATPASELLTVEERTRYARQLELYAAFAEPGTHPARPDGGVPAQVAVKRSLVVLVDCGQAGARLLQLLAELGVGRLATISTSELVTARTKQQASLGDMIRSVNPHVVYDDMSQSGTAVELREARTNLLIYCPDRFDAARAAQINAVCLEHAIPWLTLRARQLALEIGPLVVPGETACYECYTRRLTATGALQSEIEGAQQAESLPVFPTGLDWLALDVVKHLTGISEPISRGRLWRLHLVSGQTETHTVLKLPRCPACGVHLRRPLRKLWEE